MQQVGIKKSIRLLYFTKVLRISMDITTNELVYVAMEIKTPKCNEFRNIETIKYRDYLFRTSFCSPTSLQYKVSDPADVHMFDSSMSSFLILCYLAKWPNVKLRTDLTGST